MSTSPHIPDPQVFRCADCGAWIDRAGRPLQRPVDDYAARRGEGSWVAQAAPSPVPLCLHVTREEAP